jgi:hypothetical protein
MSLIETIPLSQLSIQFGDISQKLQNFQDDFFEDLLSDFTLPYLALNFQRFPKIRSLLFENSSVKSRLNSLLRIISSCSNHSSEANSLFVLFEKDLNNVSEGLNPKSLKRHKLQQCVFCFKGINSILSFDFFCDELYNYG